MQACLTLFQKKRLAENIMQVLTCNVYTHDQISYKQNRLSNVT